MSDEDACQGCGRILLGENCDGGTRGDPNVPRTTWRTYTAAASGGAALVAMGIGVGHLWLADYRRDRAGKAQGIGERGFLIDQAEAAERIGAWSMGIGVPLALGAVAFYLYDVLHRPPTPLRSPKFTRDEGGHLRVIPAMTAGNGSGLLLEVTF